jgi:hypothetical protein
MVPTSKPVAVGKVVNSIRQRLHLPTSNDNQVTAPVEQTGQAPRSELTLEETAKLEKTRAAKAKKTKATDQKPKRVSALDAAAQVLAKASKPMRAQELIAAMAEQNLWKSPGGKTPAGTLYAAMMREARDKGDASRFRKVERGQFAFAGKEA